MYNFVLSKKIFVLKKTFNFWLFNQRFVYKNIWFIIGDGTVSIHNYGANSDEEHGWQSGEVIFQ